jgi:hypothetical protein
MGTWLGYLSVSFWGLGYRVFGITVLSKNGQTYLISWNISYICNQYLLEFIFNIGMLTTDIQTERAIHEKQEVIKLRFAYDVAVLYATYLMDSGTDIRYIQALTGHKHSKTTEKICPCYNKKYSENRVAIRRLGDLKWRRYYVAESVCYLQNMGVLCGFVAAMNKLTAIAVQCTKNRRRKINEYKKLEKYYLCSYSFNENI